MNESEEVWGTTKGSNEQQQQQIINERHWPGRKRATTSVKPLLALLIGNKDREIHQTYDTQAEGISTPNEVDRVQQPQKMLLPPKPPPAATQTELTKPSSQRLPPDRATTVLHSDAENIEENTNIDKPEHSRGDVATGTAVATRHSSQKQTRAAKQRKSAAATE